jgi:hypothetical protein
MALLKTKGGESAQILVAIIVVQAMVFSSHLWKDEVSIFL